jgi:hypothetical protein
MPDSSHRTDDNRRPLSHSFPPSAPPWSEVAELGEGTFRIRLGGSFAPQWLANLCRGLAERKLSIDRAHALRARNLSWLAELHVTALPGAPNPTNLPYIALTERNDDADTPPLSLSHYELVESADHGGTLRLTLEADDTLGLLGALLAQLALLVLAPIARRTACGCAT